MNPLANPLHPLRERLERSRRRLQGWRLAQASLWVAVASAGLYGVLQLLARLGVSPILLQVSGPVALGLLAGGWLVVLMYVGRTAPDLLDMARLAEARFALRERLSTALEASNPARPANALQAGVYQQLLQDAARHAAQVEPARLIPFGWPRPAGYLLAALAAAALLQWLPTPAPAASPTVINNAQAETALNLQRLAQVVRQDAEQQSDPYLQAVARSLEQMSADLKKGQLKGQTLERELARTLDRLAQRYGLEPGTTQGQQAARGGQNPGGSSAPAGAKPDKAESAGQAPTANPDLPAALKRLASQLEARQRRHQTSAKVPAGEAQNLEDCSFVEGGCVTPEERARLEAEIQAQANRVRMAGPQGGSPGGSGDQAGKGSQGALGARQKLPDKAAAKPLTLPAKPRPESLRRISVSAPTRASGQAVQDGPAPAGGWQYWPEAPLLEELQGLDAPRRSVVSQYFSREQE